MAIKSGGCKGEVDCRLFTDNFVMNPAYLNLSHNILIYNLTTPIYLSSFDNETYLSEKDTADRNFCLGFMMKEAGAFPPHVSSAKVLEDVLNFYFMCCSIQVGKISKDITFLSSIF